MSSENEKTTASPDSGPKIGDLTGAGTGWKPGDALECAWGLIANAGSGDWDREGPEWKAAAIAWRDRYWHPTLAERPPTVIVETGFIGRPAFDPSPVRCPHCGHVGTPDQECTADTCANCGMDVNEPPVVDPPDGKMSAGELREVAESGGDPAPGSFPSLRWAEHAADRELHPEAFGGEDPAPRTSLQPPCECWKMAGWRNCPRHRHLSMPPAEAPMHLSPRAIAATARESVDYILEASRCAPGTDLSVVVPGSIIEAGDVQSNGERVPAEWVGTAVKASGLYVYRGVPLGEPAGEPGPAGISGPPSPPPVWLAEALGQARAADLADAGHRLAKCGVCGRLLYEKSGVFVHDGEPVPAHVGVATEIFDPAPANEAGVCFTAPPVGFWEAVGNRLFPQEFPTLPEVEWAPKGDVIHLTGVTEFSILDRLRLIVSGRMMTRAMIVCENEAGRTKSVMTVRPLAPGRGDHR